MQSTTKKDPPRRPFRAALPAVLFVTSIFFLNFLSRVTLSPLMPVVEADLGLTHADAGNIFLALAVGNGTGLLLNGFLARYLRHRRTVGVSAMLVGCAALVTSLAPDGTTLLLSVLGLGTCVGLYLPSGIATLTSLVRKQDWGKTMATHELAPNTAYVVAPLLAEAILLFTGWRSAMTLLGAAQIVAGVLFLFLGRGGHAAGSPPSPAMVRRIASKPLFWLVTVFFGMAVGISIGPYTMMPLFLVDAHGYTREAANQLLSVSRIMAVPMSFVAGIITDRWGARRAVLLYLVLAGASTLFLAVANGPWLVAAVVAQPISSVLFFAPGLTLISLAFPPDERTLVISLMGPLNAFLGVGVAPAMLGHLGAMGRFDLGFMILGAIPLCFILLLPRLPGGKASA